MKTHPRTLRRAGRRAGQTILFLAFALLVLALVVLWQFDIHKVLNIKARTRNGGDAAALAAARWQAQSLNLVGHLNVMQAVAIANGLSAGATDFPEARSIAEIQARLCFTGPLLGMASAQLAAKKGGMYVNEGFTADLFAHANQVRTEYSVFYPSAYPPMGGAPTSWHEYADMLEAIAEQGVAAGAENMSLYSVYSNDDHMLLNPAFYDAIASKSWCWFYHNAYNLLQTYSSYRSWPPLPAIEARPPVNAEFFSLKLQHTPLLAAIAGGPRGARDLLDLMAGLANQSLPDEIAQVPAQWFYYRPSDWTAWTAQIPDGFPWEGDVKPEYNYFGADAAVRIEETTTLHTDVSTERPVTWTAAAKPFGQLEGNPPNFAGLVLPGYTDVRLIPVDTSSAPAGGIRAGWLTFIYTWLPVYMQYGPAALPDGNFFCRQLKTWEDPAFRREGIEWLNQNSADCTVRPGGGGGGGGNGGTRRGH